jgi:hypothetical protein
MIQPGDVVEATLVDPDTQSAVSQLFTVTAINGTAYAGGQFAVDTAAGWQVRLSRKSLANLRLPTTLSEIYIIDRSNNAHLAVGRGEAWRDESGALVDLTDVFAWTPVPNEE